MAISDYPVTGRLDIEASADAFRAATFTITNASGSAVTGWSAGDSLDVQVWPGDNNAALDDAGVSCTWNDAANGIVRIITDGSHEILPSVYQWRLLVTNADKTFEVCRGNYTIKSAPGETANCLPASQRPYTSIDDLRAVAPWIDQLKSEFDRTGFEEQQIMARAWLDTLIVKTWSNRYLFTRFTSPNGRYWDTKMNDAPDWLKKSVNSGKGVEITPIIKRACALYACHLICMAQITVKDDAGQYGRKAAEFRNAASQLIDSCTFRVKSDVTSTVYDVIINTNVFVRN